MNQKKPTILEYLAFISIKQGVYLAELYQTLVLARQQGKTTCQNLTIEYRGSLKDQAIFLITKETKVIAQFRVLEEILLRKNICFEDWMSTDQIRKHMNKQLPQCVQDLRHGMRKVNIEARVLETSAPLTVQTRYGNSAKLTNAWIADETGKIKLCLWNDQAEPVTAGKIVQVKNAQVYTFKGERQLCLGRIGTVNVLQNQIDEMKEKPEYAGRNTIYA